MPLSSKQQWRWALFAYFTATYLCAVMLQWLPSPPWQAVYNLLSVLSIGGAPTAAIIVGDRRLVRTWLFALLALFPPLGLGLLASVGHRRPRLTSLARGGPGSHPPGEASQPRATGRLDAADTPLRSYWQDVKERWAEEQGRRKAFDDAKAAAAAKRAQRQRTCICGSTDILTRSATHHRDYTRGEAAIIVREGIGWSFFMNTRYTVYEHICKACGYEWETRPE